MTGKDGKKMYSVKIRDKIRKLTTTRTTPSKHESIFFLDRFLLAEVATTIDWLVSG